MIKHTDPAWSTLKVWLLNQIDTKRRELEEIGITQDEANACRGWIAGYRHLISEAEPRPIETPSRTTLAGY